MLDKSQLKPVSDNVSEEEIVRFDEMAEAWWDPNGAYRTALAFNQCRVGYICEAIEKHLCQSANGHMPFADLSALDIGCGAGLICEPLALKGADVTGIDASGVSIEIARRHAKQTGVDVNYRHMLASQLVDEQTQYDVVINAEVIEHVPDQAALTQQACELVKPGGLLVMATLNRNFLSWLIAIVGAEYVMRYLPIGTHSWDKFVKPEELALWVERNPFTEIARTGMKLNPFSGKWRLTDSTSVNYLMIWKKAG